MWIVLFFSFLLSLKVKSVVFEIEIVHVVPESSSRLCAFSIKQNMLIFLQNWSLSTHLRYDTFYFFSFSLSFSFSNTKYTEKCNIIHRIEYMYFNLCDATLINLFPDDIFIVFLLFFSLSHLLVARWLQIFIAHTHTTE